MSKYSDETTGHFHATMEINDWQPIKDIFGNIHSWQHNQTGRVVSNSDALNYFQATQSAPVPF